MLEQALNMLGKSRSLSAHTTGIQAIVPTLTKLSPERTGPDIELLTEIMYGLGEKHVRYGVKSYMFPIMGACLIETLQEILGDKFQDSTLAAWNEVYGALSGDMTESQQQLSSKGTDLHLSMFYNHRH
jgi:nitric oxide dioxygenase